jgi:glycosyltransferase involved in cell wall biosynthesis
MPTLPCVSIITPSYNQAQFLEQTIRSVLDQNYPNLEYWVIDGGSTDGSLEIIQKYAGQLAGWVSEPDRGQAEGINKGLARATGDIVAWLNSDDLYYPGAVQAAVEALAANPQTSFVFSDVESIDDAGKPFHRMRYGHWGLADLMRFRIIGQPAVFLRRTYLAQTGLLDPSYHYLLDHHLWLRLAALAEPVYVPGELWAAARMHAGAKNMAQAAGFAPEALQLAKWILQDPHFEPLASQMERQIWAGAYRLAGFYLMESGQAGKALSAYARSFWRAPDIALQDWKRILSTFASVLGLHSLAESLRSVSRQRYQQAHRK